MFISPAFCLLFQNHSEKCFTGSELTARLEPAFLAGLRSVNPTIRIKFMDIFSKSIRKRVYDRLMYIVGTQNWEHMGNHYWIKQCLELLMNIVQSDRRMLCSSTYSRLPSCTSVLRQSSNPEGPKLVKEVKEETEASAKIKTEQQQKHEKDEKPATSATSTTTAAADTTASSTDIKIKIEPMDTTDEQVTSDQVAMETETDDVIIKEEVTATSTNVKYFSLMVDSKEIVDRLNTQGVSIVAHSQGEDFDVTLEDLAEKQGAFFKLFTKCTMGSFVHSVAQLSHRSTILAHKIWVDMFPQLWDLVEERHHQTLSGELGPFLSSGSHIPQTEGYRSSINTLVEGMSKCDPPIPIRPIILKYLGKTHNLWHQAALILEGMSVSCADMVSINPQLPLQQPWLDFGNFLILFVVFYFVL